MPAPRVSRWIQHCRPNASRISSTEPGSRTSGQARIPPRALHEHHHLQPGPVRQHGDEPVRTGCVTSRSAAFALFRNADATPLLACGGVPREGPRET